MRNAIILTVGVIALLLPTCKKEKEPAVELATPPATQSEEVKKAYDRPVLVAEPVGPDGKQKLVAADPRIADDVNQALNTLATAEPEKASAEDLAAAKDPVKLLGKWQIVHTIHSTNGKTGPPTPPLARTIWNIEKDGRISVLGGMKMEMRYVYTGERLIITGLGPKLDYKVVKLTDDRLEIQSRIEAGTTVIENTTVLKRP